jgi:hypothetical protein
MPDELIKDPVESAFAFWRGHDFWFCCDDEDCLYDKLDYDGYCIFDVELHGYNVKIWKDGSWSTGTHIPTTEEHLFWQQMSSCYASLPDWFNVPWEQIHTQNPNNLCKCSTQTIITVGCQCGGI